MTSDLDLLEKFARQNLQDAFGEIVRRRLDLVYSAALRQVRSPQLAEEIAQSVFADLARSASKMSGTGVPPVGSLTPWLYAVTRRTAIDVIRKESRRQLREQIAVEMNNMSATTDEWTQIAPLLDDAMNALDETDRSAVLLRYFENKNLREVGEALGTSDDAAQKRVSRAVERLREFFSKHNITIGAGGLAVLISANAVQAAPVSLAQTIITTIPSVAGVSLGATFFASVLGKTLIGAGAVAVVFLGAEIYFHAARQFSNGKFQTEGSQGVLANGNQVGLNSQRSILHVSKTATGENDDPKLDEAIAHLRIVLHTRPTTHQIYDYEQITNAIEKFGNKERLAFNILRENVGDSEEFVRAGAFAGIGFIGKSVPEAAPFLWNVLYSSSSRDLWFIFRALQNIGFGPWDLPALTELLGDPISNGNILTELVPEAIAEQIARNPQTAKPYLPSIEMLLDDPNPDTQFRAALALIKAEGAHNPKIFSVLHALFQRQNSHQNEYYENLAVQIVGDTGPVARPLVPDLLDFAKSAGEIGVQEATYQAIAKIEPDLSSQIPGVARALKEQQDDKMWSEKWKSGSYTFDDLRAALKDRSQALTAADHLVEMGAEAKGAVPGMIKALWGKDEDTRNKIVTDIHKIDPSVVITKINMTSIYTGGAHEVLDKQPDTQQNKILKGDLVTLELFSGWCLPEELAAFTNKLAAQDPDAYRAFVKDNKSQNE
jgi:RNA polymerase sigma factor (sigma-70 family)